MEAAQDLSEHVALRPGATPGATHSTAETKFHYWQNPSADEVGKSVDEFLHILPGPTHIHLSGQQPGPCRAAVTLMHGNEPSGLHGVFGLLKEGLRPLHDAEIFIPCVDAARHEPGFVYRTLPQQKDINRCFAAAAKRSGLFANETAQTKQPDDLNQQDLSQRDLLAAELLQRLAKLHPECCLDVHNTSGASPAFGVATFMDAGHEALVSLFTRHLVVTGIKLGALMELSRTTMPIVTIECGGAAQPASHDRALAGLRRYFTEADILNTSAAEGEKPAMEFFHHPLRLELVDGRNIAFGSQPVLADGVTLLPDVERFNFGPISPEDQLGFVGGALDKSLSVKDYNGAERVTDFFRLQGEALYPCRHLKLFMVTTNPEIARRDCLFYIVEP